MRRIIKLAIPVLFVLTIVVVVLAACNKGDDQTSTPEVVNYDAWEYSMVTCDIDRGNNSLVCSTNDGYTMFNNVLVSYGKKGWELTAIFDPGENSGSRTLVFKRQP
ncbi:MAG: hypothetical protein HPY76_03180 [Anaerolineae bacterium]|jgi:hypothetical protein|nr:hypothetical protein [Anaerolineae bacterium]